MHDNKQDQWSIKTKTSISNNKCNHEKGQREQKREPAPF